MELDLTWAGGLEKYSCGVTKFRKILLFNFLSHEIYLDLKRCFPGTLEMGFHVSEEQKNWVKLVELIKLGSAYLSQNISNKLQISDICSTNS